MKSFVYQTFFIYKTSVFQALYIISGAFFTKKNVTTNIEHAAYAHPSTKIMYLL